MNNREMTTAIHLIAQLKNAISRIRADDDYITLALAKGKMNPKLRAVCIASAENWEPLARSFPSLQDVVEDLAGQIVAAVMPIEPGSVAVVSLEMARELQKAGVKIVVEVDVDDDAMPVNVYGVFDVRPDLKFAI